MSTEDVTAPSIPLGTTTQQTTMSAVCCNLLIGVTHGNQKAMSQPSKLNQQPEASAPTLRVFYNSACPVCDAGIRQQRKKMPQCPVAWQDIHSDHELAKEVSSDLEFVRERLHVIDEAGQLHIGFDAFIEIWQRSPSETWKAKLSSPTPLRWSLNKIYNGVARMLYRWNRAKQHW